MAITELTSIVQPPASPLRTRNSDFLRSIERELGLRFPDDYKDFAVTYGSGGFFAPGGICIEVLNPLAESYSKRFDSFCESFRELKIAA
jgi:hypothetical protein